MKFWFLSILILLGAAPAFSAEVAFSFSSGINDFLTFSGGLGDPNNGSIGLRNNGVAGTADVRIQGGSVPPGIDGYFGLLAGGPWAVNNYLLSSGTETADLVGSATLTIFNTGSTTQGVKANVTLDRITYTTASSTLFSSVSFNIGPWAELGTAETLLYNAFIGLPTGIATISFNSNGVTLATRLASNGAGLVGTRPFTGDVSHVPEPGFYGVLAAGLGFIVWTFRRRATV